CGAPARPRTLVGRPVRSVATWRRRSGNRGRLNGQPVLGAGGRSASGPRRRERGRRWPTSRQARRSPGVRMGSRSGLGRWRRRPP
ncbi:MAG: hypothetical protein AVDCRST_MAG59-1042, partial [uncultured Thermomicrobiales bacterium]